MKLSLINSFEEATQNAVEFNNLTFDSESDAMRNFGRFFHWYYFPEHDIFGPSKFIGNSGVTLDNYQGGDEGSKQGRRPGGETQEVLDQWFQRVNPDSDDFQTLKELLVNFASGLGKNISKSTFSGRGAVYVPKPTVSPVEALHSKFENGQSFYPEEAGVDATGREGAVRQITVNAYERNRDFRTKCIKEHGTRCCICGISFAEEYGPDAEGYIHVHHLRPLSELGEEHDVNPVDDLRPICPNCHAAVHLGGGCRCIEEVRQLRERQGRTVSRHCR